MSELQHWKTGVPDYARARDQQFMRRMPIYQVSVDNLIAHYFQTKKYVLSICGSTKAPRVVVERVNAN